MDIRFSFHYCWHRLLFIIMGFGAFTTVGANEVGIIFDELNGGVLQETYGQGLHTKSPFDTNLQQRTAYIKCPRQKIVFMQ